MAFKQGSEEWVELWQERMGKGGPVKVDTRYTVVEVNNIDVLEHGSFEAKVLLVLSVPFDALYSKNERKTKADAAFSTVTSKGIEVQEWTPWLEIEGKLSNLFKWVKVNKAKGTIEFNYELIGEFSLGRNESSAYYPFDFHELTVKFSSNWDSQYLIFQPYGGQSTKKPVSGGGVSAVRTENLEGSLRGRWKFSKKPLLAFGTEVSPSNTTYSNVSCSVCVSRRFLSNLIYDFMRPATLATLAAISGAIFDSENPGEQIQFNIGLLVAMSLSVSRKKTDRVTFSDLYTTFAFLMVGAVVVLDYLRISKKWNPTEAVATLVSAAMFAALNGLFVLYLSLVVFRKRHATMKKHSMTSVNICGDDSSAAQASIAGTRHVGIKGVKSFEMTPGNDDDNDDDGQV